MARMQQLSRVCDEQFDICPFNLNTGNNLERFSSTDPTQINQTKGLQRQAQVNSKTISSPSTTPAPSKAHLSPQVQDTKFVMLGNHSSPPECSLWPCEDRILAVQNQNLCALSTKEGWTLKRCEGFIDRSETAELPPRTKVHVHQEHFPAKKQKTVHVDVTKTDEYYLEHIHSTACKF